MSLGELFRVTWNLLIKMIVFKCCFFLISRIHYTADQDIPDDKAIIVKPEDGVYTKRPAIFKGNLNRNFNNVNYMEGRGSVEYDEDDDDEASPVVRNGDIV